MDIFVKESACVIIEIHNRAVENFFSVGGSIIESHTGFAHLNAGLITVIQPVDAYIAHRSGIYVIDHIDSCQAGSDEHSAIERGISLDLVGVVAIPSLRQ